MTGWFDGFVGCEAFGNGGMFAIFVSVDKSLCHLHSLAAELPFAAPFLG